MDGSYAAARNPNLSPSNSENELLERGRRPHITKAWSSPSAVHSPLSLSSFSFYSSLSAVVKELIDSMGDPMIPGLPDEISRECLARVSREVIPAARDVCKLWREEILSPSFYSLRREKGLARPVIAMAQTDPPAGPGKSISFSLAFFDPHSGEWSSPPPVPGGRLPIFCQVVAVGRELVVLGGWDPATWIATNEVFIYDLASDEWRRGSRIPGPRRSFFACAAATGGRTVYIAGGHDEEKNSLRSAMAYDMETDSWSLLPDMAKERDECCGVFRNGVFLVIGGYSTDMQGNFLPSSESFDPATGQWMPIQEEKSRAAGVAAAGVVAAMDGRLFRCVEGQVEVLEMTGMAWQKVAELPETDEGKKTMAPRLALYPGEQNKLVLIGSSRRGSTTSAAIYTLEIDLEMEKNKKRWIPAVSSPENFIGHVQSACCLEI